MLVEEHIFFPNITFMASTDTSLLQTVSSLYVLWHIGSGVALQSPGDCLVHRMQPPRHCLSGPQQCRGQVSHSLRSAGGLQPLAVSCYTHVALPWSSVWGWKQRGIIKVLRIYNRQPPVISNRVIGHWSFDHQWSWSFWKQLGSACIHEQTMIDEVLSGYQEGYHPVQDSHAWERGSTLLKIPSLLRGRIWLNTDEVYEIWMLWSCCT